MKLQISPERILRIVLFVFVILFAGNIITILLMQHYKFDTSRHFIRLFNFNQESNFPTVFSFLQFIFSALISYGLSNIDQVNHQKFWLFLSLLFMFLGLDEICMLHEMLIPHMRVFFNTKGYLYYAWIIPYLIFAIIIGLLLLKFILMLPKEIAYLFAFSGFIYVGGAIGMEMIGGKITELTGEGKNLFDLRYQLFYTIEESMEMLAISIFIYSQLRYLRKYQLVDLAI